MVEGGNRQVCDGHLLPDAERARSFRRRAPGRTALGHHPAAHLALQSCAHEQTVDVSHSQQRVYPGNNHHANRVRGTPTCQLEERQSHRDAGCPDFAHLHSSQSLDPCNRFLAAYGET